MIEDCSPYYVRFRHEGSEEIIKMLQKLVVLHKKPLDAFTHYLTTDENRKVVSLGPMRDNPEMCTKMAIITIPPGAVSTIHSDVQWHLNYIVNQEGANGVVNWYDPALFNQYPMEYLEKNKQWVPTGYDPRLKPGYNPKVDIKYTPPTNTLISARFLEGDVILFNSSLLHDFQNRSITQERSVMISVPADTNSTFEQAKEYFKFNSL